jgi:intracellular multiplication protein IcmE
VAIGAVAAGMVGVTTLLMHRHGETAPVSQVAKMKVSNLLPGGLQGTPAQDALQKKDSQEKAKAADAEHKSYTPPIPSSTSFNGPVPVEVGMDAPAVAPAAAPVPAIVTPPPPRYTPPERPILNHAPSEREINGARVTRIAAGDAESYETPEDAKVAVQLRRKAIGDFVNGWNFRAPETTVVLEPASVKPGSDDPPSLTGASGRGIGAIPGEKVLVPAGRGIYAHTVLAVDSDTNGPIVLEADTGPIAGDRMIGTFSKSGLDRLVVKVETVEHRSKQLEANGIVVAPDSMETAVASSIDQHYVERFVLPAAAAFVAGLGQAAALSNSTSTVSPFGGTTQTFGPLNFKQEAMVAGGSAASAVAGAITSSIPKGPTVHLAANVSVGVMFLSNLSIK